MHTTSTPAHLAESEFNWILTGIRSEISLVFQDSIGQKPKKKKKECARPEQRGQPANKDSNFGCLAYFRQMLSKVLSRRRGRTKLSTYQFLYSEVVQMRRAATLFTFNLRPNPGILNLN